VEVYLDGVAPDAMRALLEYFYLGETSVAGLDGLLALAQAIAYLGVRNEVKAVVQRHLHASVNVGTCLQVLNGIPVNFVKAFSLAWRWLVFHFEEVAKSDDFLLLEENKVEMPPAPRAPAAAREQRAGCSQAAV